MTQIKAADAQGLTIEKSIFVARKAPQFLSTIFAGLGSFGLGTVMGWSSPALPNLDMTLDLGKLSTSDSSWIASSALGVLISGPIAGWCVNKFGRRMTMLALCFPFLFGWFVMLFSQSVEIMCVGRFITGFAAGAYTIVITVYVSEIIEDRLRGVLSSIRVLMQMTGMLYAYVVGALFSWCWLTLSCAITPVVIFIAFLFIPESPRYLLLQSMDEAAGESLRWLRGAQNVMQVRDELDKIKESSESNNENHMTLKSLLKPNIWKPSLICIFLVSFQELSGINGITFFTVEIFTETEANLDPNTCTVIFGIVLVVFGFVSLMVVDKVGRKCLLASSFFVMFLSLCALGTYFYLKHIYPPSVNDLGWLPLVTVILYSVAFSIGAGPVPWLLVSELLPPQVISHGSGVINLYAWSLAFLGTKTFQDIAVVMGWASSYWMYAGICITGSVFTFVFVPETKGKSSEEIITHFKGSSVKTATNRI